MSSRLAEWKRNPFFAGVYQDLYGHTPTYYFDAASRLDRVKRFTPEQCRRALKVKGLQKSVRTAIERRLRKLGVKA